MNDVRADGAAGDSETLDRSVAPVRRRVWPAVIVWAAICALYVGLEAADLVDGLAMPVPLIAALVVARVVDERIGARRLARIVSWGIALLALPLAIVTWRYRFGISGLPWAAASAGLLVLAAGTAVCAARPVRVAVLRPLGLDPDSAVHVVSAVAVVLTIAMSGILFGELQDQPDEAVPVYLSDSLVSVLSDGTLALAGIGFLLTRGPRDAIARLDLRPIRLRQIAWAATLAGAFLVVVGVMEHLEAIWLPHMHALEDRFDYDFVGVPAWVGAVLLSLAAGVGEELVFRGALQPRFGVVITSALFAAAHIQYQVPGIVMIFVVAVGLGLVKQRTSTTFTVVVHVLYDIGAFFIP